MTKTILIFGASSKIATAAARVWAIDGAKFILVGRQVDTLQTLVTDLEARGASGAIPLALDYRNFAGHEAFVNGLIQEHGPIHITLMAHGLLGDQEEDQKSVASTMAVVDANFLSYISLLTPLANKLEEAGSGSLLVISSVAGDRGRKSNYIYGASKGGVSLFVQGLRNRLQSKGVHVATIKPGFVDTPMTAHLPKNKLFASPETIGHGIVMAEKKSSDICYLPFFWRFIMLIIKLIPEMLFKRLSL